MPGSGKKRCGIWRGSGRWSEEIIEVEVLGRRRLEVRVTGGSGSRSQRIDPEGCSKRQLEARIDEAAQLLREELLDAEREYYRRGNGA